MVRLDRSRERLSARGEDLLPSEMSRSRRLILSIYRGSSLTQLFIRRECRLYSRGCALLFSVARCNRGLGEGGEQGERERLCNPARFTYHVRRRNETPIELRTCCSELQQGALIVDLFGNCKRVSGRSNKRCSTLQSCNFSSRFDCWMNASQQNQRINNYIALSEIRPFGKSLCCYSKHNFKNCKIT